MPQRHRRNLENRLDKWLQIINLEKLIGHVKLIIVQRCLRILRSVCQTDHPHGPWRIHKNPTGNKPQRQLLQFFVFRFKTRIDDACWCCSREYYAPSCMCVMPTGQLWIEMKCVEWYRRQAEFRWFWLFSWLVVTWPLKLANMVNFFSFGNFYSQL